MNLTDDAMQISVRITAWSGRLYDRQASNHVAVHHDAAASAGRYNKCLLPKTAFAALTATVSACRTAHYAQTLPWDDQGSRLLTVSNYERSQYPFSQGLPGSMYNVPVPTFPSHWRKSRARNSGPLSDRICSGTPCHTITSDNVSITSGLPILRSTRMARHSLVYSSSSVRSRSVLPSCVLALTKS